MSDKVLDELVKYCIAERDLADTEPCEPSARQHSRTMQDMIDKIESLRQQHQPKSGILSQKTKEDLWFVLTAPSTILTVYLLIVVMGIGILKAWGILQ